MRERMLVLCLSYFCLTSSMTLAAPTGECSRGSPKMQRSALSAEELREGRARFFNQQRTYPFEIYPREKQLEARAQAKRMREAVNMRDLPVWEPIGPGNIGGRLGAIAPDPVDPGVVYTGGVNSGVWKTTDGGTSWAPLTDHLPSLSLGALAVDPLDPDIVYAGTGEENFIGQYGCKPYRSDQYPGAGVFKSTDGGETWTQAGELFSESIARIAIHPSGTDTLLVASLDGVYGSRDGGETWELVLGGIGTDVHYDPDSPEMVYAAIGRPDGDLANGIYKSTDGGRTWVRKTAGLPSPTSMGRVRLAMAPSSPQNQWIYANISYIDEPRGVYLSTDGGETWVNKGIVAGDCYKNATIADPLDHLIAYTGGLELYKTTDGGTIWTILTSWIEDIYPYDQQNLAWGPDQTTLYSVSDRGVFKTTDGGESWIDLDNELEVTEFQSVALHPGDRYITIGGTQDRGTLLFTGDPEGWRQIYPADGGATAIDPVVPTTIFTEYVYLSLVKSTDMGVNWEDATSGIDYSDDVGFYAPYVIDPSHHLTMYAGTDRVYRTTDGAFFWTPISSDLTKDLGFYESFISAIAVSEADPMVLYAGTSDGYFQVTTDGGASWHIRNAGLPNRFVMDIAIDQEDAGHVYTCVSGYDTTHVWESTDYGTTWDDRSSNLPDIPVNTLLLPAGDFASPGTIYIGTDFSCFKTTDNGASWFPFNNGLPNVVVEDMAFHRTLGFIRAATQGRSVWDVVDTTATSIGREEGPRRIPSGYGLEQNYPNPFNPETAIFFDIPAESGEARVEISISDVRGRLVKRFVRRDVPPGRHRVIWDGKDASGTRVSSGVYLYTLRGGGASLTRKMVVLE